MGDAGDCPDSPPLPRGSYNINFDELDDSIDPFKPRGGLSSSPGSDISNPFKSKTKLASSPPNRSKPISVKNKNNKKAHGDSLEDDSPVNKDETTTVENVTDDDISRNGLDLNVENPFKTRSKVAESPSTIEENPFQTKVKLSESPPSDIHLSDEDPFKSKTKLSRSPEISENAYDENPFQSRNKLGKSPPNSESHMQEAAIDNSLTAENEKEYGTKAESQEKSSKGLKTRSKSQTPPVNKPLEDADHKDHSPAANDQDGGSEFTEPKPVKKPASPKKSGLKKPKAKSKFRPPPSFGVPDNEDVIFASPPPQRANEENNTSNIELGEREETYPDPPIEDETSSYPANEMTTSEMIGRPSGMIDSVHDFGAAEMPVDSNEDFVPQSEAFDDEAWEMMGNTQHENVAAGRESLNAFDPLTEASVPDKVTRRASEAGLDGDSVIEDEDLLLMNTPPSQKYPSTRGVARHPAARALQDHVEGDGAPKEAHVVDKMLFSPGRGEEGMGDAEVERLNAANKKHSGDISQENIVQLVQGSNSSGRDQVLKYSQSDWNKMKQELELDFNARILNKEREWSKKLADRDKKISTLEDQVLLLRSSNEDMKLVVTEFEKTIAQLQAEKEKSSTESQQTFGDIVKERDQALEDLQSVETAFSDLHQRYERTKGVVESFKKNEEVLKKCVQDLQVKLKAAQDKTSLVRQEAEEKLAMASDEMEKLRKSTTSEVARLEAALKKSDLQVQGLKQSVEQKMKENSELTAICDELIAKVGGD